MVSEFLFYLLLALLPTQLGLHFWPEWTHVLGRLVDYLSPTLYITDVLIGLILISWIWQKRTPIKIIPKNIFYSSLFIVFVIVNILFSFNKPEAVYQWLKITEFGLLGLYILKNRPQISKIIFFLSIGMFYSSVIAIAQFYFQHSLGGMFWFLGERTFNINTPGIARVELCNLGRTSCGLFLRSYGTFPHPNVLGGFLAVALPFIVYNLVNPVYKFSKEKKIWYITSLFLGLLALILTFSRSALFVAAFGLLFIIWQVKKIRKILVIAVPVLVTIFILQLKNLSITDESVAVRGELNITAIKMWQMSPIFGVGLGNFLVKLPEALPTRTVYFLQPVHNIYLLLLAETGIVGLGFFIWLAFRSLSLHKKNQLKFIPRLSLVSLLILGLLDHYPFDLQQGQILLIFLLSLTFAL